MAKAGRPKTDTELIGVRLPSEMIRDLDERRRLDPDLPSRQEVIRRILAAALYGDEADGADRTS